MILPRFIRKMLAVFRGGVSPVLILLSVALGFWFGLIPGFSGFQLAILVLVLVLNVHLGLFLLSAAVGKMLCFAGAPVLFHIGVFVQEHSLWPFRIEMLSSVPVIGMTDFSRYSVVGAVVAGPVVGIVAGALMARSVISFRRMLLKLEDGSEKFRKWYSSPWVRTLDRLLIGKRTKDAKSLFTKKTRIIRKAGVVLAVLLVAALAAATTLLKDEKVKEYAARTLTRANSAEVDLENLSISVLKGSVSASGIQVTDPAKPANNQVAIGKVTADAGLYELLLGRIVMENVEVADVRFDQERVTPGEVVEIDREDKPAVFDPCDFRLEDIDIAKLESYFKDAKALRQWLEKIRKWLPKGKDGPSQEAPHKYLGYLQARSEALARPRVLARRVLLDKVPIPSRLFGNSRILLSNISDSAEAAALPVTLEIKSYDTAAGLKITFDYSARGETPKISGVFEGLDLARFGSNLGQRSGLAFKSGTAAGQFDGLVTSESIDLTLDVTVRDMQAGSGGKGILGLDPETSAEAIDVMKDLHTTMRVVGPIDQPRVAWDIKGLQEELKRALVEAGKERLAQQLNEQLGRQLDRRLGDKIPTAVTDKLKKPEDLIDGLGKLLGGGQAEKD